MDHLEEKGLRLLESWLHARRPQDSNLHRPRIFADRNHVVGLFLRDHPEFDAIRESLVARLPGDRIILVIPTRT